MFKEYLNFFMFYEHLDNISCLYIEKFIEIIDSFILIIYYYQYNNIF
jgi:hypothetical protein